MNLHARTRGSGASAAGSLSSWNSCLFITQIGHQEQKKTDRESQRRRTFICASGDPVAEAGVSRGCPLWRGVPSSRMALDLYLACGTRDSE